MVPCTAAHWEGIENANAVYDLSSLFCPKLDTNTDLFGKLSNGRLKDIEIYITPCNVLRYDGVVCPTK